ncbi:MAG: helix-turn-helix transcriptional regulator [Clostridia bacterium]|nr:helix-turn-helix transcriptional regulator [Clostridia bacterium]
MEIHINEKLRALRKQKNVTQEELAQHLGITPQSVGKWERGEGFPDITLLPKIAFYFDVTIDALLCVDQVKIEETIAAYRQQSTICKQNGENEKNLKIWEQAYKEFPNDCRVMEELMFAVNRDAVYPCPKEKADRIIALGEAILQKSTDTRQRENAIMQLAYTYNGIDTEKALHYADMAGNFNVTREDLRSSILDGEEGVKACQTYLMSLIHTAAMTASGMTSKVQFSPKEVIEAYQFAIDILFRLYSDGNLGFYHYDVSYYYYKIAAQYAALSDREHTLKALTESCRHAIKDSTLHDMTYTAPMVNRMQYHKSNTSKNYTGNSCNLRLKALEDRQFDFIREEDAFNQIIADLEKYAELI